MLQAPPHGDTRQSLRGGRDHRGGHLLARRGDRPGQLRRRAVRLGKREFGHLHGDTLADIPFTKAIRDELLASGEIVRHRPLPDSGWGSRHIRNEDDVRAVIRLLRMQYDRASTASAARRT